MIAILLGVFWLVCLLVAVALCKAAGDADRLSDRVSDREQGGE